MNKKIMGIVGLVVVLAVILFAVNRLAGPTAQTGKLLSGSDKETFSGTITAVNTGCFADGICSVDVDGKNVIVLTGWGGMRPDAVVGKLIGVESIGDMEDKIGWHANVYATTTAEGGYTLYGSKDYYVEVLDLE